MTPPNSVDIDVDQATGWLVDEAERLRSLPWEDLAALAGKREHRAMQSASGRPLYLETQVRWDNDSRHHLYVTLNVWDPGVEGQALPTEVVHDEFALSDDGRGGVVGPVRRREAADHDPRRRNNRRLVYGLLVAVAWTAWGWENAGVDHFSSGATEFAWAMTVAWILAILLTIRRWQKARPDSPLR